MYKLLVLSCVCVCGILGAPLLDATSEAPTIGPPTVVSTVTGGTTIPIITIQPAGETTATAQTLGPATGQTETAPTIAPLTNTIIPVTIVPITSNTAASIVTMGSTMPSSPKTTPAPGPNTPEKQTGFDGGSFGGGIALGLGICIIALVAYKCYSSRREKGYSTM